MRTAYSATLILLFLIIASTAYAESPVYSGKQAYVLIVIDKYGYIDVIIYANKAANKCNKMTTISRDNMSILSSYNVPAWLHRIVMKILENNTTSSIKLYVHKGLLCYTVFEYKHVQPHR